MTGTGATAARMANLTTNILALVAGLIAFAAAVATTLRHESATTSLTCVIVGMLMVGGAALDLAQPPSDSPSRRIYWVARTAFGCAALVTLGWLLVS